MNNSLLYYLLIIIFSPLILSGYFLTAVKGVLRSRKYGISATAISPLSVRWMLHKYGIRDDPGLEKMIFNLPSVSKAGLKLSIIPVIWASRISKYVPMILKLPNGSDADIFSMVNARTRFFDEIFSDNVLSIEQVVISGAGFDTRLLKYFSVKRIPSFEIDLREIQSLKKDALGKGEAEIDWIEFIPIDFNIENWTQKLEEKGFDRNLRTLFLWEGVTYYLSRETVIKNLRALNGLLPKGSLVALDVFTHQWIFENKSLVFRYGREVLRLTGESWKFGIDGGSEAAAKNQLINELLAETDFSITRFERLGRDEVNFIGGLIEISK